MRTPDILCRAAESLVDLVRRYRRHRALHRIAKLYRSRDACHEIAHECLEQMRLLDLELAKEQNAYRRMK